MMPSYCAFEWLGSTMPSRYATATSPRGHPYKKFIHSTCFSFCLLKTYMRSNRDIILALIEKPEPVTEDIPLLPLTTQPTVSPSIQNQSDAVAKKEEEESCQVLDMSGVVRGDQKVLYRPGSFTRVRSNTDEVGYN
ncbi:unnamed protein product [Brassica oleracea var. botrytis]|nr:unnamed protein product [Brassica napus]